MSPFGRSRSLRSWTVLLGVAVGAGIVLEAQQRPAFRAGVELVSLSVTVTGAGGRYIDDLTSDDFTIIEDGRPQELTFFSRASTAMAVSLLMDSSASMDQQMPLARRGANEFISRLRPDDLAEIVEFNSRVQVLQPFTSDRDALERAIASVTARGATSLYTAVYVALRQFPARRAEHVDELRRNVIVVLSDGEDTSSLVSFDELLDVAKRSQGVIYTIGLGLGGPRPRVTREDPEFILRRLSQETGGRLFTATQAADLAGAYMQIADELTNQYVLGYQSGNSESNRAWRSLAVRVNRPNVQARTRPGYYADTTAARGR